MKYLSPTYRHRDVGCARLTPILPKYASLIRKVKTQ